MAEPILEVSKMLIKENQKSSFVTLLVWSNQGLN